MSANMTKWEDLPPYVRFVLSKLVVARSFPRRHRTKSGPGRMPFAKGAKPPGSKLWGKCPTKLPEWDMNEDTSP